MSEPADEFRPCQPVYGICDLVHDHALHGGSPDWPVKPWYAMLRKLKTGDHIPEFRGFDANYPEA